MADQAKHDQLLQDSIELWKKKHDGTEPDAKQLERMNTSVTNSLAENEAINKKAGGVIATTLNVVSYGSDGAALFTAGSKGNLLGQTKTYGYDLLASSRELKGASGALVSEGILSGAGRSASLATLKSGGAVLGRLSVPLTVGLGAWETVGYLQEGKKKSAMESGTGTALSLGASIAAGAAAGTLVTPLVGTVVGAVVGVGGYYLGRYIGGAVADKVGIKDDFTEAAKPVAYTPSRLSVTFDPNIFKAAPSSQAAFAVSVKPVGVDVTKVAEPEAIAANETNFIKKPVQNFNYNS